jgi:hypothetical protein
MCRASTRVRSEDVGTEPRASIPTCGDDCSRCLHLDLEAVEVQQKKATFETKGAADGTKAR